MDAANRFCRTVRHVLENLEEIPPCWRRLRLGGPHATRPTSWATRERAEEVARNQGKPARVVEAAEAPGRFGVEIYS